MPQNTPPIWSDDDGTQPYLPPYQISLPHNSGAIPPSRPPSRQRWWRRLSIVLTAIIVGVVAIIIFDNQPCRHLGPCPPPIQTPIPCQHLGPCPPPTTMITATTIADCALTPNSGTPPPSHIDSFNLTLPTGIHATFNLQEDRRTTLSTNGTAAPFVQRTIHLCPQNQVPFATLQTEIMAGIAATGSFPWTPSQESVCGAAVLCLHLTAQTTFRNPFDEYISLSHTAQNDNGGILTLSFALIPGHDMVTPDHSISFEPGTPADIVWSSPTQILIAGRALAVAPTTAFDLSTVTLNPIQHCGGYTNDGMPQAISEQRLLCASTQQALFAAVHFGDYTGTGIPVDWILFPTVFW